MNDNTVLRIKVPAHLYESVKKQLTLKEAKGKTHYGAGMEVVKEKKLPKKGMEKVEEIGGGGVPSTNPSDMGIDIVDAPGGIVTKEAKKGRSLEELMKAKERLENKINEMEKPPKVEEKEKVDEVGAGVEYAWIPGAIGAGLIAANVVKAVRQHMKEKNLTGLKGFWQAYQEVGKSASSTIDQKMSGGMEEAKDKEKKAEDKLNEAKDKEKKEESFEVVVHKNNKKVSRKDYNSRKEAESAFETASKDLKNDVYLNDEIGKHIKIRKAKKEDK